MFVMKNNKILDQNQDKKLYKNCQKNKNNLIKKMTTASLLSQLS
jgi:hypothetical protein